MARARKERLHRERAHSLSTLPRVPVLFRAAILTIADVRRNIPTNDYRTVSHSPLRSADRAIEQIRKGCHTGIGVMHIERNATDEFIG